VPPDDMPQFCAALGCAILGQQRLRVLAEAGSTASTRAAARASRTAGSPAAQA